jgi:hypothetical protein
VSSQSQNMAKFFGVMISITTMTVIVFVVCHWLGIVTAPLSVWLVSLVMLWWLAVVVTLPWNLYFQALQVLSDAKRSQSQSIKIESNDLSYVKRWAQLALFGAIALHLVSAVGFYLLAVYAITPIGYYGAGAALALVGLRPAIRAFEYVSQRIAQIGREVRYPRDDVLELTQQVEALRSKLTEQEQRLDLQAPASWAAKNDVAIAGFKTDFESIRAALEDLRRRNEDDHRQLARSAEQAAARVGEDSQVLGHVRELLRFFKQS